MRLAEHLKSVAEPAYACLALLIFAGGLFPYTRRTEERNSCLKEMSSSVAPNARCTSISASQLHDEYIYFLTAARYAAIDIGASSNLSDLNLGKMHLPPSLGDQVGVSIANFRDVVESTPWEDGAWANLALLHALRNDPADGLQSIRRAISIYRFDATYYVILGLLQEREGQIGDAAQSYRQALLLNPRLAASRFWSNLGQRDLDLASGAIGQAIASAQRTYASTRIPFDGALLARLRNAGGDSEGANAILSEVLGRLPNLSGAWELQGEILESQGNGAAALLAYRKAVFLDSRDPLPRARLAALALRDDKLGAASVDALLALNLQRRMGTSHSTRSRADYRLPSDLANDFVLPGFLPYLSPKLGLRQIFLALSEAYRRRGMNQQASRFAHLGALQAN